MENYLEKYLQKYLEKYLEKYSEQYRANALIAIELRISAKSEEQLACDLALITIPEAESRSIKVSGTQIPEQKAWYQDFHKDELINVK